MWSSPCRTSMFQAFRDNAPVDMLLVSCPFFPSLWSYCAVVGTVQAKPAPPPPLSQGQSLPFAIICYVFNSPLAFPIPAILVMLLCCLHEFVIWIRSCLLFFFSFAFALASDQAPVDFRGHFPANEHVLLAKKYWGDGGVL